MKNIKPLKLLRTVCLILAIGFCVVPMLLAFSLEQGLSKLTANILMTVGMVLAAVWLFLGVRKQDPSSKTSALLGCIILVYLLIKMWV